MNELNNLPSGIEPNTGQADRIICNMKALMEHPWAAIEMGIIYTLDPTDLRQPIKKFPNQSWLRELTELWLNEPLFASPKSRRMLETWLMVWNHLWLAMFGEGRAIYFQSEKEDKSNKLVQRAEFIYNHMPSAEIVKPKIKNGRATWCKLDFYLLRSFIEGVAQGANQLRQEGATAVLMDEAAFWEKGRESFAATKPTIEGGGRVTVISSAHAGWFRDLVFDEVT